MKTIKALSVIGLAATLALQGLLYIFQSSSAILFGIDGILGLATAVLMFISLKHWISPSDKKR